MTPVGLPENLCAFTLIKLPKPWGPIHTGRAARRTTQCKQMGRVVVNGSVHTAPSNIKGFAFQFACASHRIPRPVWIRPEHETGARAKGTPFWEKKPVVEHILFELRIWFVNALFFEGQSQMVALLICCSLLSGKIRNTVSHWSSLVASICSNWRNSGPFTMFLFNTSYNQNKFPKKQNNRAVFFFAANFYPRQRYNPLSISNFGLDSSVSCKKFLRLFSTMWEPHIVCKLSAAISCVQTGQQKHFWRHILCTLDCSTAVTLAGMLSLLDLFFRGITLGRKLQKSLYWQHLDKGPVNLSGLDLRDVLLNCCFTDFFVCAVKGQHKCPKDPKPKWHTELIFCWEGMLNMA